MLQEAWINDKEWCNVVGNMVKGPGMVQVEVNMAKGQGMVSG